MEKGKLDMKYFNSIFDHLYKIQINVPWAVQVLDQVILINMDLNFMLVLCSCFARLDEESKGRLRSIITRFKFIWTEEYKELSLLKRLAEARPIDMLIEDFHSVIVELTTKIMQTKQQFEEGWCEKLMHSSMNYQSSTLFEIGSYLGEIRYCMGCFSRYRAAKIVTLKKGIDILIVKIEFLTESVKNIGSCTITMEILQFQKFADAFANKLACLALMYWSKEDNEETATEMKVALFDMLQNFIPWAPDIISLYICFLKSYDLQTSDSFLIEEAVESFVDLFFDHMDTILKDDFLILRDRLTILFTYLIDHPCYNVEEEELIRSQIYALFREDKYFKLPFHRMKDDFSNKKILLGDCMMKIDITIAKIRELDHGFTDTWIRLDEIEKMEYAYFVSIQRELSWIEKHAQWVDPVLEGQLQLYKTELRFLSVFLLCFTTWDDADEEIRVRLNSMITTLYGIWEEKEEGHLAHRLHAIRTGGITDWLPLAFELKGKIQLSKLEIGVWWINLFHLPFRCKTSTIYKILKCLDSIMKNLNDLVSYKNDEIVPFKKQIEILNEKVSFLKNFLKLTLNCINGNDIQQLLQRLPAVRKLSCSLIKTSDYHEELPETLDFHRKLESLKLIQLGQSRQYLINFPSTLKKLTLVNFQLPWTAISSFGKY